MTLSPPKKPCGSCPYRKDVPSGIWHEEEYSKLSEYDKETHFQPLAIFMCHQKDGCICGGWLMTHDRDHLLALRIRGNDLDPSVWDYYPDVDVFSSGKEAADHGISGISNPSDEAKRKIDGIMRKRILA